MKGDDIMSTKCFIKDNAGITPLTVLLIIFVLAAIISCFWYIASTREITCTPEDQVKLTGVFKGYFPSQNYSGLTVIVIGNNSYFFKRGVDQNYLNNLIGHTVCFQCCKRVSGGAYRPELYYDLLSGVIED